jgi:hypothetical protein
MNLTQLAIATCILALWAVALLLRDRFVPPAVTRATIKFTHALPAILQMVLFAYWSIYWPQVLDHLPVVAVQLGVAYAFDFLLAWTLRRPYSPSLGPVPIVLSTNLFVWFPPGDGLLYMLVIAIALTSKALILSGGRHIFNPSVFGIAGVGVLCIVMPGLFHYQDISHDFDRPPYMAHVILLLALIPQVRLRTAPVAVGAALAMVGAMLIVYSMTGYRGGPNPWWPPWLLAITLLAGDPATIPSASLSRLLFGLFLGAAFYLVSRALIFSIGTDFFSKIIPIPLANLLVPSFERAGTRLSVRWPGLGRATANRAYVAAWVSMSVLILIVSRRA